MAIDVKLPGLGEGIDSGDVLELLVKEGDVVTAEQGLMELETDKATVTLPSPAAGKVLKILVAAGDTIPVGQVVAQLEAVSGSAAAEKAAPPAPAAEQPAAEQPPSEQAVVAEQPAQQPAQQQPVQQQPKQAPAAAPPATPTPAPATPTAKQQPAPAAQPAPATKAAPAHPPTIEGADKVGAVAAGPAVRRFAREVGVDLSLVAGTGAGGRISRDDVLRSVRESNVLRPSAVSPASTGMTASAPTPAVVGGNKALTLPGEIGQDDYGPIRVERMSRMRKTIAAQMHKSWSTVARVTNFDDADVTALEAFRKQSRDDYASEGIKLTTMPFLMKAVAMALRLNPLINATIDSENDQIVYRDYVNLGVAVDTDRGLVVPNIRRADTLSIPDFAKALADLAGRVRTGEFGVDELRGGTFTISNLGAIGGTYSTPIINIPEVAILLVGRTRKLPVVMDDDSIQAREMMPLSLSYDHRLVDGGTAARFLNDLIGYLEAPSRLLLAIS